MGDTPTAFEQLLLEYTNQARMNPGGEYDLAIEAMAESPSIARAISYFGVDMDAYLSQMEAFDAVAPLSWNTALATAAQDHSQLMIDLDQQDHVLPGEDGVGERIEDAGYDYRTLRENIFAYSQDALYAHIGFMVDWGYDGIDFDDAGQLEADWQTIGDGIQDGAGHRVAIMSGTVTDIGISALEELDSSTSVGPWVVTQDFGTLLNGSPTYLLGVVIDDLDGDAFYDIGEGLADITVTATNTISGAIFSTTTWEAGGYQMELESGTYSVVFSGGELDGDLVYAVTMTDENTKLDGYAADAEIEADLVQTVAMPEGFEALYAPDTANQVYRLYLSVLGREPDNQGHLNWTERLAIEGYDLLDVVNGFVGSAEFASTYGGLNDTEFVTLMYQNVLDRDPDATGLQRWTGDLSNGMSRSEVALGFSESAEFKINTTAAAQAFALGNSPSEWGDDVYRLYQATLNRAPDLDGFTNWSERLGSGMDYLDVANGFVSSDEFQATYGDLDNTDFITLLYANVLDRLPDAAGLANWVQRLDDGMSRVEGVKGFSQSVEFVTNTAASFADWVRQQGTDDIVEAGSGPSILAGGLLSDQFVFNPNGQANTAMGLEEWDTVDLVQFALQDVASAQALLHEEEGDVVFDDGNGTTITFESVSLEMFTEELILV